MTKVHADMTLEDLLEWFYNHYEDAVHGVFYDGGEGGYQYLTGAGPCEPLEVLQQEFPRATREVLREAEKILLSEGSAWVKQGTYGV